MTLPATRPDEPDFRSFLDIGRAAWAAGRREDAVRCWRKAVAGQPEMAAGYVNIAGARSGDVWVEGAAATIAPGDPVVAKNLGVLAHERGSTLRASTCLMRSLILAPEAVASIRTYAKLPSEATGGSADDLRWSLRAAVCEPGSEPAWSNLLLRLLRAGEPEEAARRAGAIPIAVDRWSPGLLTLAGRVYSKGNRTEEGLGVAQRLVERRPGEGFGYVLRALFRRRVGDDDGAMRDARRAAIADPASFDAECAAATMFCHIKEHDSAVRQFRRCLRIDAGRRREVLENLVISLLQGPELDKGERLLREMLVAGPEQAELYISASSAYYLRADLGSAARYGRIALAADPANGNACYQMASVRRHQGRIEEARTLLRMAVARNPEKAKYRFAQALLELGDGDAAAGVQLYDARWDMRTFPAFRRLGAAPSLPLPVWQGDIRPHATLAIWGEQGVGDEIWFAAYLAWAVPRVRRIVLEVTPHLVALLQRSFPTVTVLPRKEPETEAAMAAADMQLPLGGLMRVYGAAALPVPTGYLATDPQRVAQLRRRYTAGATDRRVIGVSWRSIKPTYIKSFEAGLEHWDRIFALEDAVFVSLQYGDVTRDVAQVAQRYGRMLLVDRDIDAYRDLDAFAAQVAAVDVVVSVGNSTVAMAHALDKPVHVLVRAIQEDWRYARHRERTHWLPTARCAWQPSGGGWTVPIGQVAKRLSEG